MDSIKAPNYFTQQCILKILQAAYYDVCILDFGSSDLKLQLLGYSADEAIMLKSRGKQIAYRRSTFEP